MDVALYDGFLDNADAASLAQIRRATPQQLASARFDFHDQRLPELLFRYRARNWPETLTPDEIERWEQLRVQRLTQGSGGSITFDEFSAQIALLRGTYKADESARQILNELEVWSRHLLDL